MIPETITIEGIGPYTETTTLDFTALQSPISLVAPYGTGKTFLLESIMAALYGSFAWYDGSIYEALTQGGTGDGRLELLFTHGGKDYRAIREIHTTDKTKGQKAMLYNCEGVLIAGPKVGDFEAAIVRMIGDRETFLATQFLSQNRANDLCGQPGDKDLVARRRAVFNSLIGADRLDAVAEKAGLMARGKDAVAKDLEAQIAGEPDYAEIIKSLAGEVEAAVEHERAAQAVIPERESELETLKTRLRDAQGGEDVLRNQVKAYEAALDRLSRAKAYMGTVREDHEALSLRAAGLEAAKADAEELERKRGQRAALQETVKDFQARQNWERELESLQNKLQPIESRIETLLSMPGLDDATVASAEGLEAAEAALQECRKQNAEIEARNNELRERRNQVASNLATLEGRVSDLRKRIDAKPVTPFGDDCAPCPLFQEYAGLEEQYKAALSAIEEAESEKVNIPADTPMIDLAGKIEAAEKAKAARKAVETAEETRKALEKARNDRNVAMANIEVWQGGEPPVVADPSAKIEKLNREIENLSSAPERASACKQAAKEAESKAAALRNADLELEGAGREVDAAKGPADAAQSALTEREAQQAVLVEQIDKAAANLRDAQEGLIAAARYASQVNARLEEAKRHQEGSQRRQERLRALRNDVDGLRDLRTVFGPKGARQILTDNAAPELEAIADDLFERATGGRMRLRIATQMPLADGSLAEDFRILVKDGRGERDALRYSGGQLQLIQILFRIAVSLWVGHMRGQRPECLFLDEAFDRLGADGTEDLLRVLDHLADQIALIVVVTHDVAIADRLRSSLRLTRRGFGIILSAIGKTA